MAEKSDVLEKENVKDATELVKEEPAKEAVVATDSSLVQEKGQTVIADQVVAKIAGLATREVPGVYSLGNSAARALGAIRSTVGLDDNIKQGISVEVGQTQAAVDLTMIVEYPYPIHQVAEQVRSCVLKNIEGLVGLEVTEVNIQVVDVHIDTEDDEAAVKQERVK